MTWRNRKTLHIKTHLLMLLSKPSLLLVAIPQSKYNKFYHYFKKWQTLKIPKLSHSRQEGIAQHGYTCILRSTRPHTTSRRVHLLWTGNCHHTALSPLRTFARSRTVFQLVVFHPAPWWSSSIVCRIDGIWRCTFLYQRAFPLGCIPRYCRSICSNIDIY